MTSIYPSSSNSNSSSKNLLRISGMASGIDTDSVVKAMVSSYQTKIDKANQAKQTLQWKQEGYRDIIKQIKGLQDYFDPLSSKYILGESSTNINSATSDKTSVASATASSSAQSGTYVVTTNNLAEQARIAGTSLDSMVNVTNVTNWSKVSLKVGNADIDLSSAKVANNATVSTVVSSINSQIATAASTDTSLSGISASYVSDGTNSYIKFTKSSSNTSNVNLDATYDNGTTTNDIDLNSPINSGISSSTKLSTLGISTTAADGKDISFTVNGKTVTMDVDATTTVQNLMDAVKSATSGAVTMSIDDTTGSISFQSKSYGSTSSVTLVDDGNFTLSKLNVYKTTDTSEVKAAKLTDTGTDANVTITAPGQAAVTTTQSSNQFTMNGMNYNLVNTGTANITVTADSDKVVTNIKNFIKDYNSVISTINTKLTEKKNNDYAPLTDAQKESMSEDQITSWETKAKVGVLRNDDYLSNLMTQMRGIFSTPVYSSYTDSSTNTKLSLSFGKYGSNAIGIDTSTDWSGGGQLVLEDENKLKSVIENNLDDFKKLFIGTSNDDLDKDKSYIGSSKYREDGIFQRMNTILKDYVASPGLGKDGTYTLSGSMNIFVNKQYDYSTTGISGKNTLPDQVYSKTLSISKLQTQMSDAETRYYAKFTAMETALNTLNSQQSQLSSMLGTS